MSGCSQTQTCHWKWVFGIDIETGPACGGAVRMIAYIEDPVVIREILLTPEAVPWKYTRQDTGWPPA